MEGACPLRFRVVVAVALAGALLAASAFAQNVPGVGLHRITLADPIGGKPMQAMVFYPSAKATERTAIGPYRVDGAWESPPEPGRHALVVISHGHLGSMLGHHDLASALARAGYVVASLTHAGDSFQDQTRVGTADLFLGRPRQLSALISAVLADPAFAPLIDETRIGACGFSMGGYTVLLLAGAQPDFTLIDEYCARPHPLDLCAIKARIREFKVPEGGLADRRVRAVVAMAPLDAFFGRPGLAAIACPVLLFSAEEDGKIHPEEYLEHVRDALPAGTRYETIPGAGHFVFLAPCSPEQAASRPDLCTDPEGVDRLKVHEEINGEVVRFFGDKLAR